MRALLRALTNRYALIAIGVISLSLLVWFGGPFIGFGSAIGRLLVILALVVIWAVVMWVQMVREARATAAIATGAAAKSADPGSELSAEARALRETFAEAAATLRRSSGGRSSLYDLPWYAFIGPPGTGKTTLIERSGLRFPVAQRSSARRVSGAAGTRNCHWWFSGDAVLLDTAGRFTTQDSDAAADRAGWLEFLSLLKKYRRRRPLNGLFVAYSAADLARASDEKLETDALIIRERLDEVLGSLKISLPVYFLVTQCDLVSGFSEFFDDLDTDARRQVWGFTFDVQASEEGTAVEQLASRMAELSGRLGTRVAARLNAERDLRRRVAIVSFPSQFASLEGRLDALVRNVFSSSKFDRALLLRGVYFTSGTQVGAPVDRIMVAIGREFGFAPNTIDAPATATRAYFIEKLLRGVVFSESGLAGTQRHIEARKALLQLGAYVTCAALAAIAIVWLSVSFAANSSYLEEVQAAHADFEASEVAQIAPDAPVDTMTAHLDGLRAITEVAERKGAQAPWSMRLGLYQAGGMGNTARDAYTREVNNYLVPLLSADLRERLGEVGVEPENLFESLKAYLLLYERARFERNKADLGPVADAEWERRYGSDPSLPPRLTAHLAAFLDSGQPPLPAPFDEDRVRRTQASLVGLTPARLIYMRIHRKLDANEDQAVHLDVAAGAQSEKVFVRRSGQPLGTPLSYAFTSAGFDEIGATGAAKEVASFVSDAWVYGDNKPTAAQQARLPYEVLDVYEDEFITAWDRLIADVALRNFTRSEVPQALAILSAADSPLRSFVRLIADNTTLVKPESKGAGPKVPGRAGAIVKKGAKVVNALDGGRPPPGTRVTEHFRAIAASAPSVDKCLSSLTLIQQQLEAGGLGFANNNSAAALNQGGSLGLAHGLRECAATLPGPLAGIMKQAAGAAQDAAVGQVRGALDERLSQQVGSECNAIVSARYPFVAAGGNDVPVSDFGRLFGVGGQVDTFFRDHLSNMVEIRGNTWRWKDVADTQVSLGPTVLPNFQRAARIRDAFFQQGGQQPHVRFTLLAESLDPDVVRFALEVDGQQFEYRHDPPQPWSGNWPGSVPGVAAVRFIDRAGKVQSLSFQGPWAFFRLLGAAEIEPRSETRYRVTFRAGGKTARLFLDATSIRNPFDRDLLTQFRCPR